MSQLSELEVRIVGPDSADLLALIAALDDDIEARYPRHRMVGLPAAPGGLFFLVVAYLVGTPVGCGALRELAPGRGELKRMYVSPWVRRRGVARRVIAVLEAEAVRRGYAAVLLETGVRQPEALALYKSCDFRRIPAFGEYVGSELSVCLEKDLG